MSTENTVKGAKFVNAKPVYFPQIEHRFDNDNRGGSAYRTAVDPRPGRLGHRRPQLLHPDQRRRERQRRHRRHLQDPADLERLGVQGRCRTPVLPRGSTGSPVSRGRKARADSISDTSGRPFRPLGAAPRLRPLREQPIALVRNGKEFHITADQSTVRAGTEILVKTERPKVTLSLSEMDQGSWVIFELPGFTKAASGTEQASLDALRKANETSYFRDGDALWVKLVVAKAPVMPVRPSNIQASIAVSRGQAVAAGTATGAGENAVGKS